MKKHFLSKLKIILALSAIFMLAEYPFSSSAQIVATTDCLPPLDTIDAYTSQYHVQALAGLIDLNDVVHFGFGNCNPPPDTTGQTSVDQFTSTVAGNLSVDGGQTYIHVCAPCNVTVYVTFDGLINGLRQFSTEMTQLDLNGGDLPAGYMVRESPTLHSYGLTTIKGVPGNYTITSYFDINIELSNNNGGFWIPADTTAHVNLTNVNYDSCFTTGIKNFSTHVAFINAQPNPSHGQTVFSFVISNTGNAQLEVFDLNGKLVATPFNDFAFRGKIYSVVFETKRLPAGVYFYKLSTAGEQQTSKLVIME